MAQPEYDKTEKPLIQQLEAMGWVHLQGAPSGGPVTDPAGSGREDFAQVVYPDRFKSAVARLNPGPDGRPWLSPNQLDHLFHLVQGTALGRGYGSRGVAGNLEVTELLRTGVHAATHVPGWIKGKNPAHVRLVDWDGEFGTAGEGGEKGNDFLAVSQFRVDRKGAGSIGTVVPDLVLFVNGLPWAVVECKAPLTSGTDQRAALDDAVDQVIGYAGAQSSYAVPEFVRYAQVLIGTDRDSAELGTVTADATRFAPWRTTLPASEEQVRAELGKPDAKVPLPGQDVLVAGALRPEHLLTLVRDFTTEAGGGLGAVKIVGRYQQFRAVHKLARKLEERRRKVAAGELVDHRGGVVWHTQGSGKSLTMALLVRHLRSTPALAGHKVVVVTDRLDLEKQILGSLAASNERIHQAKSVAKARAYLAVDVPDVVLITLQKARRDDTGYDGQQEHEDRAEERLADDADGPDGEDVVHNRVQNPSSDIVVLVDEAHRGQARWQHARLRAMLPNAVFVGFTGTPILSGKLKTTEDIFGTYADTYTLRDAERDGAVVPVRYEAWDVPLEVVEQAALDADFDEKVPEEAELRERVLRKFARRKEVLEAPSVIKAKAAHMLEHWAGSALPDRFGAQIVAASRLAAVRYRDALLAARDRLLARLDALDPALVHDPMAALEATAEEKKLLALLKHRALLESIDAAVIISKAQPGSGRRDPREWQHWTTKSKQDAYIKRFKDGLGDPLAAADDPSWEAAAHGTESPGFGTASGAGEEWNEGGGPADAQQSDAPPQAKKGDTEEPMAFLVVQSMLLTGFDAPVEQVLYLDSALSGAGLLQAVARTNRPYPHKKWGQIVDFVGVGAELARSFGEYDQAHLRQVYGYDQVSLDHLARDFSGTQPDRDGLLIQTDAAAEALLADLHRRITGFLEGRGVASLADEAQRENLLAALEDPLLRGEFDEAARNFLTALNAVLPSPKALEYEKFAGLLGEVQYLVRRRYLDERDQFSPRRYGAKIRELISRHLKVTGIDLRIPPVELTAPDFMERVNANRDPRTRTSYMTSSLRLRINVGLGTQPARYRRFSERLEEIVQRMRQDFEQAAADLAALVGDLVADEEEQAGTGSDGLEPLTERPVFEELLAEIADGELDRVPAGVDLYGATRGLCLEIADLVQAPDVEYLADSQDLVRMELRRILKERDILAWRENARLAAELVKVAVAAREHFLSYGRLRGRGSE